MKKMIRAYSKEIYTLDAINRAIDAYAGISAIQVKTDEKNYLCSFKERRIPIQRVLDEFSNYLLEVLNNRHDLL